MSIEGAPKIPESQREKVNSLTVLNREAQGALIIETLPPGVGMDEHWGKWVEGGKDSIAEVFRKAVDDCLLNEPDLAELWVREEDSHPAILDKIKNKMLEMKEGGNLDVAA